MLDYREIEKEIPEEFQCDGCTNSPDWLPTAGNIRPVCRVHDWLYSQGGDEDDRLYADKVLRDGIRLLVKERATSWLMYLRGMLHAWIYYRAVRRLGKSHFKYDGGKE